MPYTGGSDAGQDRPEVKGPPSGRSICVYLGGNLGREQRYIDEADALGRPWRPNASGWCTAARAPD